MKVRSVQLLPVQSLIEAVIAAWLMGESILSEKCQ